MIWAFMALLGIVLYAYIHLCVQAVLLAAYDKGAAAMLLFWGAFALECQVAERGGSIKETRFNYNFYPTFLAK